MDKEIDILKEKFYNIGYEDGKLVNKQRIEKAVEYIKEKVVAWNNSKPEVVMLDYDKIMNILKGDDNDR